MHYAIKNLTFDLADDSLDLLHATIAMQCDFQDHRALKNEKESEIKLVKFVNYLNLIISYMLITYLDGFLFLVLSFLLLLRFLITGSSAVFLGLR